MKKAAALVLSVITAFLLTGCTVRDAISDASQEYIISALGFDSDNQSIKMTVEALVVNNDDINAGKAKHSFTAMGKTVKEAYYNLIFGATQPLTLAHCSVVAIGKTVNSERLAEILEFCSNEQSLNVSAMLVYTENSEDLLKLNPLSSVAIGYDISGMAEVVAEEKGVELSNKLYEIRSAGTKVNSTFYIPNVVCSKEGFSLEGMAVFKNNRFVCLLNSAETQLLSIITDSATQGRFIISGSEFEVKYCKTAYEALLSHRLKLRLNIRFNAVGDKEVLREKILQLLENKAEKYGDIFLWENIIYQKYPKLWERVREDYGWYFENAEFEVVIYE